MDEKKWTLELVRRYVEHGLNRVVHDLDRDFEAWEEVQAVIEGSEPDEAFRMEPTVWKRLQGALRSHAAA